MRSAIELAAPIRRRLGLTCETLAPGVRSWCKRQMRDVASISSAEELREQLPKYLAGIGVETYAKYVAWHAALPPEAKRAGFYLLDERERLNRVFIHDHHGRPEETSVAAWDVARAVHYATLGFGAGYLAEHEAWQAIDAAAKMAQAAYRSWAEYAAGFLYGRWFWVGYWDDGMKETGKAIDGLLDGDWQAMPWSFELGELVKEQPAPAVAESLTAIGVRMFVDCPACLSPILVRTLGETIACESCGARSTEAATDAWKHGLGVIGDPDEDEDEEEEDEEEDDDTEGLSTNLDDRIQRVAYRRLETFAQDDVIAAPAWLKAISPRIRYVARGSIALGRPDAYLTLVFA